MKLNIIKETPLSASNVKAELERIKERDKELNYRAQKTEDYAQQIIKMEPKKAKELEEKLGSLNIPRLKEQHICKIMDILPATIEEVKAVLQGYALTITNENLKKIADTIAEFAPPK